MKGKKTKKKQSITEKHQPFTIDYTVQFIMKGWILLVIDNVDTKNF